MAVIHHPPTEQSLEEMMASTCFGCGIHNEHGHQIRTYWDGEKSTCTWMPRPEFNGGGDYVYGGTIAGLMDCHQCLTAVLALYAAEGRTVRDEDGPSIHAVTANLNVDYLAPTPIDARLEMEARVISVEGKKVRTEGQVTVNGVVTVKSTGLFIRVQR